MAKDQHDIPPFHYFRYCFVPCFQKETGTKKPGRMG